MFGIFRKNAFTFVSKSSWGDFNFGFNHDCLLHMFKDKGFSKNEFRARVEKEGCMFFYLVKIETRFDINCFRFVTFIKKWIF